MLEPVLGSIWPRPSITKRSAPVRWPLVLCGARTSPNGVNDSWAQLQQVLEVPAIQWQRINRLVADRTAQSGISSVNGENLFVNRNSLTLLSRVHHQVDPKCLTHFQQNARVLDRLESFAPRHEPYRCWGSNYLLRIPRHYR